MKTWIPSIPIHSGDCYICGANDTKAYHMMNIKDLENVINCADDNSLADMYRSVALCPVCCAGMQAAKAGDDEATDRLIECLDLNAKRRFIHLCTIVSVMCARAECAVQKRLDSWGESNIYKK